MATLLDVCAVCSMPFTLALFSWSGNNYTVVLGWCSDSLYVLLVLRVKVVLGATSSEGFLVIFAVTATLNVHVFVMSGMRCYWCMCNGNRLRIDPI